MTNLMSLLKAGLKRNRILQIKFYVWKFNASIEKLNFAKRKTILRQSSFYFIISI